MPGPRPAWRHPEHGATPRQLPCSSSSRASRRSLPFMLESVVNAVKTALSVLAETIAHKCARASEACRTARCVWRDRCRIVLQPVRPRGALRRECAEMVTHLPRTEYPGAGRRRSAATDAPPGSQARSRTFGSRAKWRTGPTSSSFSLGTTPSSGSTPAFSRMIRVPLQWAIVLQWP